MLAAREKSKRTPQKRRRLTLHPKAYVLRSDIDFSGGIMKSRLLLFSAAIALVSVAGCATSDQISLVAAADQLALTRDGVPALISRKNHVLLLRPNSRQIKSSSRPSFTIAALNAGSTPQELFERAISAWRHDGKKLVELRVFKYDELVQEENTRQTVAALGAALVGVSRGIAAANSGYVTTTGSYHGGSYGTVGRQAFQNTTYGTYSATTYDPLRAQLANRAAQEQTDADFAAIRQQGEANLAQLQDTILKDNTVLPGEWYGGTIVLDVPEKSDNGSSTYTISVRFGGETHEFQVSQTKL